MTVPEPPAGQATGKERSGGLDPQLLRDVQSLAERVGGLEKLREVVDVLLATPR